MNSYRPFNQLRSSELVAVRHNWLNAWYELSDGQFNYGTISYRALCRRKATIETNTGTWLINKPLFSRVVTISKPNAEVAAKINHELFARASKLVLSNGFQAQFSRTGVFPTSFTWQNETSNELLTAIQRPFSFKKPINILLNPIVKTPETPLLALLSVYLIILRQRRKAAAH